MFTKSLWNAYSKETNFPALDQNIDVDVAIIGGGITGITTALLLKKTGLKVAVLEAMETGKGTTSHSTGNLYVITDQLLSPIKEKYDLKVLKKVIDSRREAFKLIKENIMNHNIDCDYKSQSMYVFEDDSTNKLMAELHIANEIGLGFNDISRSVFPFEMSSGMALEGQATFNPLLYVQGLAHHCQGENCSIYENTAVREIEESENEVLLTTTSGIVVAKKVIHATHTPKGIELQYHTVLGPYREYGVAVTLEDDLYPDGIYWGYIKDQKFSLRTYERQGEKYLLCIGKPHKVGQAEDNRLHIEDIITFLNKRFKVKNIMYKWGGQHYKSADLLPYIGQKSEDSKQYLATGFATDGLIYGTLSAIMLNGEITGFKMPDAAEIFKASRHHPLKAAKDFVKENIDVATQFVKGVLKSDGRLFSDVLPGEAKIIQKGKHKLAVRKDIDGCLKVVSALCTHMGCVVHYNKAEDTWDCPCHGSRFSTNGTVIEGPALKPLENFNEPNQNFN
jgi:glycine/D-amino acid oxidase-like deaminating enzyme/nitrite reductase/ring-hydroxylating ferredoxin subunit